MDTAHGHDEGAHDGGAHDGGAHHGPDESGHGEGADDVEALVAANRTANPRRTPGREPLGLDVTRRATIAAMLVVGLATVILVVTLAAAR